MDRNKKLTPTEWEIMESVWELGGAPSVREVLEHSFANGRKAYTTVQTIMNNLEKKGLLVRKKIGLVNFYSPLKIRSQIVQQELSSIISRVFKGSAPAMANYLINSDRLTLDEIGNLKQLITDKESELRVRK
ncbi:MAG: BlaI/MecI/CopY family transcriptional regulator [Candidatus Neomarinimicrobiota bacterium]